MPCVCVKDKWGSVYAHHVESVSDEDLTRAALRLTYENGFEVDEPISVGYSDHDDPGLARLRVNKWVKNYRSIASLAEMD
jgi:hypothetical protein